MDGHRNSDLGPIVNPFCVFQINIDAPMTHRLAEVVMPVGVVDVDVRIDAQVVRDEPQIVIVRISWSVIPNIINLGNFG